MKRSICMSLAILMIFGCLCGCGAEYAESAVEVAPEKGYTADNEIVTYSRIDPQKTQIVISRTGNIPVEQLCLAFEEANPDIQVIYIDITGGDSRYMPLVKRAEHGDLADVVISAANYFDEESTAKYFQDLSADPIIQNYEAAALQRTAIGAKVYLLPGPSDISAIMYNKTLFESYGWETPATFDEFVALCDRIREDTDGAIEAWNPNAKYGNELVTALEAMTYEELLGGLDNRSWYNAFINGSATFTGHMEPYVSVIQTLIDHGIIRPEHFSYSATTRGKEFAAGNIAMINVSIYAPEAGEFELGYIPYPTTEGDTGYLCDKYSCYVGLPVKEHSEEESAAIKRFVEYFSSVEGQQAYIGSALKVSNVKGVAFTRSELLSELQPAIDEGHMFGLMEFYNESGGYSNVSMYDIAVKMVTEGASGADCLAGVDARRASLPGDAVAAEPPEVLATATEDLSILETSFLFADAYREAAGADIGLIANNAVYRGNLMRIYAGDFTANMVCVFKPRSFANGSTLVKVSMTGAQMLDALNHPLGNDETEDCIYAYSGLKCEVAPWNALGEKYLSVTLADGSPLEPDRTYTAALWSGTVADKYISEVLETYEGTWEEIITAKLRTDGVIAPARDGRITLVWD